MKGRYISFVSYSEPSCYFDICSLLDGKLFYCEHISATAVRHYHIAIEFPSVDSALRFFMSDCFQFSLSVSFDYLDYTCFNSYVKFIKDNGGACYVKETRKPL